MQVKRVLLCIFCVCVFVFAAQAIAGEFFDDFEDPDETAEKWEFLSGEWLIGMRPNLPNWLGAKGGPQDPFDANVAIALPKLPDGRGIDVEDGLVLETEFVDTGGGGRTAALVMLSYVNEEEAYYAGGYIGGWQIYCVHKFNPTPGLGFTQRVALVELNTVDTEAGEKAGNQTFIMKMVIEGDSVIVYIDDKEAVRYIFPAGIPEGRVGLISISNNANYNWVQITGSFPLIAVDFRGKLSTVWGSIKVQAE